MMAKKTISQLIEEKNKVIQKSKNIDEKIKLLKQQQGNRIALIAADIGLAEMDISDEEWRIIFTEVKQRFQPTQDK